MVRINKVYTKTGDKGKTRLAGGQEIDKTAHRIEAYGTVDELNACLGLAVESIPDKGHFEPLKRQLLRIQNELFDLGSQLAVLPEDRMEGTPVIKESDITVLEKEMDRMNEELPILKSFILPGGGEVSATLHLARTVCRRAERCTIRLADQDTLDGTEIPYLNRLSDWLFVASREAARLAGREENMWKPGER